MASFVPDQDKGVVASVPTGTAFGRTLEKQPVPWSTVVAMFKTTSDPKPTSAPLIAQNTTLEQDKATVLRCWLAMGGKGRVLKRGYH